MMKRRIELWKSEHDLLMRLLDEECDRIQQRMDCFKALQSRLYMCDEVKENENNVSSSG